MGSDSTSTALRGSREFVGARLELARAFRHATLQTLADQVSTSVSLLGFYENGLRKQPADDLIGALAKALNVEPDFFFAPLADAWQESECSFRRRAQTPQRVRKRARAHGTLVGLVIEELSTRVKFPAYNVPEIAARTPDAIEEAAEHCRGHWKIGLGPIPQVGRVAEHNGVILVRHLQHTDKIDAFSRRGRHSVIVLTTARTSTSRWIFDVAHELGHFVLHKGTETGTKETEAHANSFASALLLPRKTFAREFVARPFSWTHIFELKRRWSASASAIITRAFRLDLLDAIAYRRCYQQMSMHGWLKAEPHEPSFAGPEWLSSALELASSGGLTGPVLCQRLNVSPALFTDITGIPVVATKTAPTPFRPRLIKRQERS